ncbi:TonB-dependent receptor, partial [Acinetobacter sp.]
MNTPPFLPRYLLLAMCIAGGYSPFYHLYAAENKKDTDINDEHPTKLPVIEVTAEKVLKAERQNQQEMFNKPYSKQIISQEKIQQEGLADVKEAIRDIPGVSITETGAFGKNVKIRGLTGQRVVSVVDGIKIANQGLDHSGSGEINQVDINNVEMIEVVKGSPAVIYDPGASGGVIIVKTKPVQMSQGIGVSQKFAYDEGYDKTSSTTSLNAGMDNFGAKVTYTKESSNDYRVRGDADKKYAISKTNALNAVNSTVTVKDLGYDAESLSAKLSGKFATDSQIDLDYDQWIGKDIASAHGNTMQDAMVMLLARKERESKSITYRKDNLGIFNN